MDVVRVQSSLPLLASQTGDRVSVKNILSQADSICLNFDGSVLVVPPAYSGGTGLAVP